MKNDTRTLKKAKVKPARRPFVVFLLICLLALLGVGAVFGGAALIISPNGQLMGMPLSMLDNSCFTNFLIPGIILFSLLGVTPILLIFALVKTPQNKLAEFFNLYPDMHWAWTYSVYIGFALIIWIQVEMIILEAVYWLHTFYMFFAIAILVVSLLPGVRSRYRKPVQQ